MSTLEVNTINPQSGTTITIGGSGDTVTLGSGATQSGFGGTNTPNFSATASTSHGVSSATWTKVQINTEHFDTANAFDTSNYRFTVPSGQAGKYQFNGHLMVNATGTAQLNEFGIAFYVNGSASRIHFWYMENNPIYYSSVSLSSIIDLSVGDYVELFCYVVDLSGGPILDANTANNSGFSGYKIIE
jgi:hypothetical protein